MGEWLSWFRIGSRLNQIIENQGEIMAAIDDVNAALAALQSEFTTFLADVTAQISGGLTADEAAGVVTQINGFTTQLQANDPANPAPVPPATS